MDNFAEALAAVRDLKKDGVVEEYAVGGAIGASFWSEPTPTFDLDVFVLQRSGALVSLGTIYDWARKRGYREEAEHIVIAGVPVQVIPAHSALAEEAVLGAVELEYERLTVRVIRPEYLIALALEGSARTAKRLARVAGLLESDRLNDGLLQDVLRRYKLKLPT